MSQAHPNPEDRQPELWEACESGELTSMVHRLDAKQRSARRRQVLNTALASTAVFACVVLALGSFMGGGKSNYGGITCSFCRDHLAEYQQHQAGELVHEDAEFVASMRTHLEKCTFCRGEFTTQYPDTPIASAVMRPAIQIALQPAFVVGHAQQLY